MNSKNFKHQENMPGFIEFVCGNLLKEIEELDLLVEKSSESQEMEYFLSPLAEKARHCYGIWLVHIGEEDLTEIFPSTLESFFHFVYIESFEERSSLKNFNYDSLKTFLSNIEFSVSETDWASGFNPFDAVISIYKFLQEIGYTFNLLKLEEEIQKLRIELDKRPLVNSTSH